MKISRMFLFFILEVFFSVALSRNLLHSENNSGILDEYSISKGINPIQPDDYFWISGSYGECSKTCGGGTQSRSVNCARSSNFEIVFVDNYSCESVPQPSKNRSCNAQKCPPEWKIGEWEECSATCERGIQNRMVYCQQITNEDTRIVVNNNLCMKLVGPRPQHVRPCNQHIRCPHWSIGPWSSCNKMCGPGEQTRSVTCQKIINDEILVFPEENCGLNEKPQSKQKCNSAPCEGVDWVVSDSSGVSSDNLCKLNCNATWIVSLWSKCSAKCGQGIQTRHVYCGVATEYPIKKIPVKQCDSKKKLESVRNCTSKPCNGMWFSGAWDECTAPCGGGVRTRKVLCITGIEIVDELSCESMNKPFDKETCNTNPCDSDEVISIDGCKDSENGCCPDNVTRAGPNLFGCAIHPSIQPEDCTQSEFGCCWDNKTPAKDFQLSNCEQISTLAPNVTSEDDSTTSPGKTTTVIGKSTIATAIETGESTTTAEESSTESKNTTTTIGEPTTVTGQKTTVVSDSTSENTIVPDSTVSPEETTTTGSVLTTASVVTNCAFAEFGCCDDGINPAEGPNNLGCSHPVNCSKFKYGCCPDGIIEATGPKQQGCAPIDGFDCAATKYGCCPDKKSNASGPNFRGCPCESMEFGCCLDGINFALGENYEGCGCEITQYGCCPDEKTPAKGTNYAGCPCSSNTFSPGHNQQGCEKMLTAPSKVLPTAPTIKVGKVCGLPSDEGSCSDQSLKWFFDVISGECDRFWYSGCEGNGNRFDTQEKCKEVCVFPEGMGACYLPRVSGSCHNPIIMWYYNDTSGQCVEFYYNGCLGNNNRFATQEKCEKTCAETKALGKKPRIELTSDKLRVRVNHSVHIPCIAHGEPQPYVYWRKDGKDLAIDDMKLYFINDQLRITNVQQNDEGEYTCIADNGYGTPAKRTIQVIVEDGLTTLKGESSITTRIPTDETTTGTEKTTNATSKSMTTGGESTSVIGELTTTTRETTIAISVPLTSGGSTIVTRETVTATQVSTTLIEDRDSTAVSDYTSESTSMINSEISPGVTTTTALVVTTTSVVTGCVDSEFGCCFDEKTPARGPNQEGCGCESSRWGCCSDGVTFAIDEHKIECQKCEYSQFGCCPDSVTAASGPKYHGCEETPTVPPTILPTVTTIKKAGEVCGLPSDEGSCSNYSIKWFFDMKYGECNRFWYFGCEGNDNRFDTQEECEQVCIFPEGMDACHLPKVSGSCSSHTIMWYYDVPTGECGQFYYSGCMGNNNRFATQEECEKTCAETKAVDICALPKAEGPCRELALRWYFDSAQGRCLLFYYGGCEGNANRYETETECQRVCSAIEVTDICSLPSEHGPCSSV